MRLKSHYLCAQVGLFQAALANHLAVFLGVKKRSWLFDDLRLVEVCMTQTVCQQVKDLTLTGERVNFKLRRYGNSKLACTGQKVKLTVLGCHRCARNGILKAVLVKALRVDLRLARLFLHRDVVKNLPLLQALMKLLKLKSCEGIKTRKV